MDKNILKNIKDYYIKRKAYEIEYGKLTNELKLLEENSVVKRYIELKNLLNNKFYSFTSQSDSEIYASGIKEYLRKNRSTNKIYIYIGTYISNNERDIVHSPSDYRTYRGDPCASYNTYLDLETVEYIFEFCVPMREVEEFERANKVLITDKKPSELQEEFIRNAIELGEEEAVKMVLSKYKKGQSN